MLEIPEETWDKIITYAGGFASLVGTVISIIALYKAKNATTVATNVKNEMMSLRAKNEILLLLKQAKGVLSRFDKYITSNADTFKGIDFKSDTSVLLDLCNQLDENKLLFKQYANYDIDKVLVDINDNVLKISDTNEITINTQSARLIHELLKGIISQFKIISIT